MSRDAFICDAVRTPIGRYGGVLAGIRTDDLGALPMRALIERNAGVDWGALDDVYYGCANQAGEDNRNVARMAGLLAGLPVGAGDHNQPPVRFRHGCHRPRRAFDQGRRSHADDRRRRRGHIARALRHGQGGIGLGAQCHHFRHEHRLALRQSGDGDAVRHALDAADGRQHGRRLRHRARRSGCLRATLAAALGRRRRHQSFRRRAATSRHRAEKRRPKAG